MTERGRSSLAARLYAPILVMALSLAGCAVRPFPTPSPTTATSAASAAGSASGTPSVAVSPSASPSQSPTPVAPPRAVTVVMNGDLLWHNTIWISAAQDRARTGAAGPYDFDPMFAALKPIISGADLAICHSEVPFAAKGATPTGYPVFAAPAEIAAWVPTMGWDLCTTDSNHSLDQGFTGLVRTKDYYAENGVLTVGTFRTEAERNTPVIYQSAAGVKVAVVGGTYDLNGIPLPEGKPWAVSMLDAGDIIAQAKRAKAAGADIVLAHMHGGEEYVVKPSAQQVQVATALTASPYIDMVFGEHVHVVQPITTVNGKWVVYGMGNTIGAHQTSVPRAYEGITTRFTFTEQAGGRFTVSKAEYIPTYWNNLATGPIRIVLAKQAVAAGTGDVARYQQALNYTRAAVNLFGPAPGLIES